MDTGDDGISGPRAGRRAPAAGVFAVLRHGLLGLMLVGCGPATGPLRALLVDDVGPDAPAPVDPLEARPEPAVRVHYGMAVLAAARGDEAEAARHRAWVRRLDPDGPWSTLARARLLRRAGDLEGAAGLLDRVRARAPGLTALQEEAARLAGARGDRAAAVAAWRALAEAGDATAWGRAWHAHQGRLQEAGAMWRPVRADASAPEAVPVPDATDEPDATGAALLDAWSQVPLPDPLVGERGRALAGAGRWAQAAADLAVAMAWVPRPDTLRDWHQAAARSCATGPVWRWVHRHRAWHFGPAWRAPLAELARQVGDPVLADRVEAGPGAAGGTAGPVDVVACGGQRPEDPADPALDRWVDADPADPERLRAWAAHRAPTAVRGRWEALADALEAHAADPGTADPR